MGVAFFKTGIIPFIFCNEEIFRAIFVPYLQINAVNLLSTLILTGFAFVAIGQKSHYIGEHAEGGIIYYLYQDSTGKEHGLVVSLKNLSREVEWGPKDKDVENCASTWDGQSNTQAILMATRDTTKAAGLCDKYSSEGFDDWYLPAIYELQTINSNLFAVEKALDAVAGSDEIEMNLYWSSTQSNEASAWFFSFYDSKPTNYYDKTSKTLVRAIRLF